MIPTITRILEIDYGHRLLNHEGKCRNYHGHRAVIEVTCSASGLDFVGRVIDFSVIKDVFGTWLDDNLDHGMILQTGDPMIWLLKENNSKVLVVKFSPTSENLATYLLAVARTMLCDRVRVDRLRFYETPNCWADAV